MNPGMKRWQPLGRERGTQLAKLTARDAAAFDYFGYSAAISGDRAVLGAPVSAGLTGFIPVSGMDPLVSLLMNSLLDGSANALLTLRIGALARRYCAIRLEDDRRKIARSASRSGRAPRS